MTHSLRAAHVGRAQQAIARRFHNLLARIDPGDPLWARYATHKASIDSVLGLKTKVIGSASRGSAIAGSSDLDLLAMLSRDSVRRGRGRISSTTALQRVRDALNPSFPQTDIRRGGQAVVVHFGGGLRDVDVVPAVFHEMRQVPLLRAMRPVYLIPTGDGRWQETSPDAHNDYISGEDARAGYKLRSVARLVKFWRECRVPSVPLQSFHVELVLASTQTCVGPRSYSTCLTAAFRELSARGARGLLDPVGISGRIPAASTTSARRACASALSYAADHSLRALQAELDGNFQGAHRQWGIVFNGSFPR